MQILPMMSYKLCLGLFKVASTYALNMFVSFAVENFEKIEIINKMQNYMCQGQITHNNITLW